MLDILTKRIVLESKEPQALLQMVRKFAPAWGSFEDPNYANKVRLVLLALSKNKHLPLEGQQRLLDLKEQAFSMNIVTHKCECDKKFLTSISKKKYQPCSAPGVLEYAYEKMQKGPAMYPLFRNPHTPLIVLKRLVNDISPIDIGATNFLQLVIKHPNCDEETKQQADLKLKQFKLARKIALDELANRIE